MGDQGYSAPADELRHRIAGTLVAALESVWVEIVARHPEVPPVVVTVASGTLGEPAGQLRRGHFAVGRWQHGDTVLPELFVGAEGLALGPVELLGTVLHEAAHGLASTRGISDTSRAGRYHNDRYRRVATELGLDVARSPTFGWTVTTVPDTTAQAYLPELWRLETALVAVRRPETRSGRAAKGGREAGGGQPKNGVVGRCGCGRQFRITRRVLEVAVIRCERCGGAFREYPPGPSRLAVADDDHHPHTYRGR